MSAMTVLTEEEEKELLRRCWYSHDAGWFMSVAGEFGLEAANRLNRRTARRLGQTEMLRLTRALGIERVSSMDELLRLFRVGGQLYSPPPRMEFEMRATDDGSYEISYQRCFVHENIARAGIAESYICAVFGRFQGWHDGLSLPLAQDPAALPCAKASDRECRRVLTIQ